MWLLRSFTYAKLEERVIYLYVDCSSNSLVVAVRSFNAPPLHFFLESVTCSLNLRIIRHLLHMSCEDSSSSYDFPSYQGFWKQSSTALKTFDSAKLFVLLSTKKSLLLLLLYWFWWLHQMNGDLQKLSSQS